MIAVQGADPWTAMDVGAVRGYSTLALRLSKLATNKCVLPPGVSVSRLIVGISTTTEIPLTN